MLRLLLAAALLAPAPLRAQGYMLLVGGGGEQDGGWSDAPYRWAVQHAANKRAAVISFGEATNWIPDYFQSLGAVSAKNYRISTRQQAQSQALYDSLMACDLWFIKGGDQWNYYDTYRGTLVDSALRLKYAQGGVLAGTSAGMAMLSGVMFTAEHGTVYPDGALADALDSTIALAGDFVPLKPGMLFDTHVAERGRIARLPVFQVRWSLDGGPLPIGIGVDDRTALALYPDNRARVFGTGAVQVLLPQPDASAGVQGSRPVLHGMRLIQAVQGDSLSLPGGQVWGMSGWVQPPPAALPAGTLLLGASDVLAEQQALLAHLAQQEGAPADTVLVLAGSSTRAALLRNALQSAGAARVVTLLARAGGQPPQALAWAGQARKVVVSGTVPDSLLAFFSATPAGQLLLSRLRAGGPVSAWLGPDARMAGTRYLTEYRSADASYNGLLSTSPGLGLVPAAIIQPEAFADAGWYENTATGVPWAMMRDSLRHGWLLTGASWARVWTVQDSGWIGVYGTHSGLLFRHEGGPSGRAAAFSGQRRNIAAAAQLSLSLCAGSPLLLGTLPGSTSLPADLELPLWQAFPNPAVQALTLRYGSLPAGGRMALLDSQGRALLEMPLLPCPGACSYDLAVAHLPPGLYFAVLDASGRRFSLPVQLRPR
jgi:cyanophycinase